MKKRTAQAVTLALSIGLAAQTSFAAPDAYDDSQSNPLRVLAYLTYPVGWLAEWTIFRPFHFLVSGTQAQEAFFGHTPHPPVLAEPQTVNSYGVAKRVPLQTVRVAPPAPPPVPVPEHVKVVEVPVEKTVDSRKNRRGRSPGLYTRGVRIRLCSLDRPGQRSGLSCRPTAERTRQHDHCRRRPHR